MGPRKSFMIVTAGPREIEAEEEKSIRWDFLPLSFYLLVTPSFTRAHKQEWKQRWARKGRCTSPVSDVEGK
jgi:hypothetical protein